MSPPFNADGWRLDVADELPDAFMENLRRSVKEENPEALTALGYSAMEARNAVARVKDQSEKPEELIRRKVDQINAALIDDSYGSPSVSMSVGIAIGDGEADSQELFHRADAALYHVKEHGRQGCCIYGDETSGS